MSRRFVEAEPAAWKYVAEFVAIGREAQGLKVDEASALSGNRISRPVWSILENARQKNGRMEAESLRGASEALGLPPTTLEELVTADIREHSPADAWAFLSGPGPIEEPSTDFNLAARVSALEVEMAEIRDLVRGIAEGRP